MITTSLHFVRVDGKSTARLGCPGCGLTALLDDHEIDHVGNVTPSVDCPSCDYHETGVLLIGWEP